MAIAASGLATALGAVVLFGWAIGSEALVTIAPRFIAMLPSTAIGMMLAGVAVIALRGLRTPARVALGRACAVAVTVLGVLALSGRVAGEDVFHTGFAFRDRVATFPYQPVGLMAINSAICFTLSGSALLLMSFAHHGLRRVGRMLSVGAFAIACVAILGHGYGARVLYAFDVAAGMSLLAATGFALVQIGIQFLRPHDRVISLVTGRDLAASVVRRLLPMTLLLPMVLGMLFVAGRKANLFGPETGAAVLALMIGGWMVAALLFSARHIRAFEAQREELLVREQQARAAAEAANKAKGDFLAVMSHELRTPLNAIVGYTGLMKDGISGPLTTAQQQHLNRVAESAQHLTNVVDDVLTLARRESGPRPPTAEWVPVSRLLREVGGILEPLAGAKGLAFSCECDAPIQVWSDPHQLRQILINLGGNAIKFTPTGSVRIGARHDDANVTIFVSDSGIGIAPENQERIFHEFWQVENPLTRRSGGAGLGLAVARQLAAGLGARLTVESAPGKGSVFSVTLPVSPAPTPVTAAPAAAPPATSPPVEQAAPTA